MAKKSQAQTDKADQILNIVSSKLSNPDDEFSLIGKTIAAKLRRLPKETRIYTEKIINDILFHAELGKITEHTKITLESEKLTLPNRSNTLQSSHVWNQSASNNIPVRINSGSAPNNYEMLNSASAPKTYQLL